MMIKAVILMDESYGLKCRDGFKLFSVLKRKVSGEVNNGVEYYHESKFHEQHEWFINKYGTSAKNTLFEPCQGIIDHAINQYYPDRNMYYQIHEKPFQLKIRQNDPDFYYLYLKINIKTHLRNGWLDIIKYYDRNNYIICMHGQPQYQILSQSSTRSALKSNTHCADKFCVRFENEIIQKQNTELWYHRRLKMTIINHYFEQIELLPFLQQFGVISMNNPNNHYYPKSIKQSSPSNSLYLSLNEPTPSISIVTEYNQINSIFLMYHAVVDIQLFIQTMLRENVFAGDKYKYMGVTFHYQSLAKYLRNQINQVPVINHTNTYTLILTLKVVRDKCETNNTTTGTTEGLYELICPAEYVQIVGFHVKLYRVIKSV